MAKAIESDISHGNAVGHDDEHEVAIPELSGGGSQEDTSDATRGSGDSNHHEVKMRHAEGERQ